LNALQAQTWPDVGNNVDYSSGHITYIPIIRCPGFMIITPSFSSCSVVFSNQSLTIAAPPWTLDLWSSYWALFVETGSSSWSSSAVAFAASSSDFYRQSSSMYGNPFHL